MAISYRLLRALLTRPTVRMGLRTSTLSKSEFGRSWQHCWDFHRGTWAPCGRVAVIAAVVAHVGHCGRSWALARARDTGDCTIIGDWDSVDSWKSMSSRKALH